MPSNISRRVSEAGLSRSFGLFGLSGSTNKRNKIDQTDQTTYPELVLHCSPLPPYPSLPLPLPSHNWLLSDEHFTVDGKRSEDLEGQNRFKPKGTSGNLVKSTEWLKKELAKEGHGGYDSRLGNLSDDLESRMLQYSADCS